MHLLRKYPPLGQLRHDAVATTVATLCGSAVEIFMCRCWATGQLVMQPTLQEAPLWKLGYFCVEEAEWPVVTRAQCGRFCGSFFKVRCMVRVFFAHLPDLRTLFWAATIVHWRIPHFYLMHRALHPWRIGGKRLPRLT